MSKLNSSSSELDLDRPNIEDYLPYGSIQDPHGKLRLRDLLDISPTLTEATGAIVDVSSALYCLRQWNTYQGSSPFARPRTTANLGDSSGPLSSFDQPANHLQESGPDVHDIVESSKTKAWTMVDAAMQAITSLKAGGNTFERIEDAIDYVSNRLSFDDSCLLAMRHTAADAFHGSSSSHYLLTSCCPSNSLHSTGPDLKNVLDRNEAQIPSELISHCVGTFLMIQVRVKLDELNSEFQLQQ